MKRQNMLANEKKPEGFTLEIFLLFIGIMGLFIYNSITLPFPQNIIVLISSCLGLGMGFIKTVYKAYKLKTFKLDSQVELTYVLYLTVLLSLMMITILFFTQSLIVFILSFLIHAIMIIIIYKLLLFHIERLTYLSDKGKEKIEEKISNGIHSMMGLNDDD